MADIASLPKSEQKTENVRERGLTPMASKITPRKAHADVARSSLGSGGSRSNHVLLVVSDAYIAVQLLRCLHDCKRKARILDFTGSPYLRWSRACLDYSQGAIDTIRGQGPAMARFLDDTHAERAFGMAMAAGMDATLMLARSMPYITRFDLFHIMSSDVLERLNDKWQFADLCRKLRLPHPETVLVNSAHEELPSWSDGAKMVLKPLALSGGRGVRIVEAPADARRVLDELQASAKLPCIFQTYVPGYDGVLGILAREGRVVSATLHWYREDRRSAVFCDASSVVEMAQRIAEAERLTGIFEFDLRYEPASQRWWLTECNPRFWASVDLSSFAGVNFVRSGLALCDPRSDEMATPTLPVGEWMRIKEYGRRMRQLGLRSSGLPSTMTLNSLRATIRDPILAAFSRSDKRRSQDSALH